MFVYWVVFTGFIVVDLCCAFYAFRQFKVLSDRIKILEQKVEELKNARRQTSRRRD